MHPGMWGGIIGGLLGLLGGAVGTYASYKDARSPRERRFVIRAAALICLGVSFFLALTLGLSSPFRWLLWVPYAVALPLSVLWVNRRLARIRREGSQT